MNRELTDKSVMKWLLFILSFPVLAAPTDLDKRLEAMVKSGAITAEVAQLQSKLLQNPQKSDVKERGEAQRGLASINPALKPMPIKQFRAAPLVLFFD